MEAEEGPSQKAKGRSARVKQMETRMRAGKTDSKSGSQRLMESTEGQPPGPSSLSDMWSAGGWGEVL